MLSSAVGDHSKDGELDQIGEEVARARLPQLKAFRDELAELRKTELSLPEQINAEIVARQIDDSIASIEVGEYLIPMTSDSAFYSDLTMLGRGHRFDTAANVGLYLIAWSRFRAIWTSTSHC